MKLRSFASAIELGEVSETGDEEVAEGVVDACDPEPAMLEAMAAAFTVGADDGEGALEETIAEEEEASLVTEGCATAWISTSQASATLGDGVAAADEDKASEEEEATTDEVVAAAASIMEGDAEAVTVTVSVTVCREALALELATSSVSSLAKECACFILGALG